MHIQFNKSNSVLNYYISNKSRTMINHTPTGAKRLPTTHHHHFYQMQIINKMRNYNIQEV